MATTNIPISAATIALHKSSSRKACLSRSSVDSGFESGKSPSPCSPETASTSQDCKAISPLAIVSYNLKPSISTTTLASSSHVSSPSPLALENHQPPFKKPRIDLTIVTQPPVESTPYESVATKLINACTSPKSTKEIRRILHYCLPSTSALPNHLNKEELKAAIIEYVGDKKVIKTEISESDESMDIEGTPTTTTEDTIDDVFCEWGNCDVACKTENDLYDHVQEAHLQPMRPKFGCSIKKLFRCQWNKCDMAPTRGDAIKKFEWLESHCSFRHLPQACPHKCIFDGCTSRFKTPAQLNSHIKNAHKDGNCEPSKTPKIKKEVKPVKKNASQQSPDRKVSLGPEDDNINRRMFDWLHQVQTDAITMKLPSLSLEPSKEYQQKQGSERRKAHCENTIIIADASETISKESNPFGPTEMMPIGETQLLIKGLFKAPKVKKPSRDHVIYFEGEKYQLVKNKPKTKTSQLFTSIYEPNGIIKHGYYFKDYDKVIDRSFSKVFGKNWTDIYS